MSLLYPNSYKVEVEITHIRGYEKIRLRFYTNSGKFGTKETLDEYHLTPEELLKALQIIEP
jgi:hypothetical protein